MRSVSQEEEVSVPPASGLHFNSHSDFILAPAKERPLGVSMVTSYLNSDEIIKVAGNGMQHNISLLFFCEKECTLCILNGLWCDMESFLSISWHLVCSILVWKIFSHFTHQNTLSLYCVFIFSVSGVLNDISTQIAAQNGTLQTSS